MSDENKQTEAARNRVDFLTAALRITAAGIIGLVVFQFNHLEKSVLENSHTLAAVQQIVAEMAVDTAIVQQQVSFHENEAGRWKDVIEYLRDAVHQLETNAAARSDPFTGTQGKRHGEMIKDNAEDIAVLKESIRILQHCCRDTKGK